jgi:hypothetical protein
LKILSALYIVKFLCNVTLLQGPMMEPALVICQMKSNFPRYKMIRLHLKQRDQALL